MAILGFDMQPLKQGVQEAFAALRQAGEDGATQAPAPASAVSSNMLAFGQSGQRRSPWDVLAEIGGAQGDGSDSRLNFGLLDFGLQSGAGATSMRDPWTLRAQAILNTPAAAPVPEGSQNGPAGISRTLTPVGGNYTGPATSDDNKALTAQQIDQWIASTRPNSPLAGQGAYILQTANQYGISAPMMLGIFLKETELGTTGDTTGHMLSGIVGPGDGGLGTNRTYAGYGSWQESIDATARNLATPLYKGKSLAEQLGTWYVGPQAWAAQGLGATDQAGNGNVQEYLNMVAGVYQALGVPVNATQPGTRGGAGDNDIVRVASSLLGTPYVAGGLRATGDPAKGLDCSEYTAWVWQQFGVKLPWNAQQQFNQTQRVDGSQLQVGDLVFFRGTNPEDPDDITHVGVYIGNGQFMNSQDDGVHMASLSSQYWAGHYAGAGRVAR